MSSTQLVIDDAGQNTLVLVGDGLVLQYRTGALTPTFLDATEAFFAAWKAPASGKPFGCLAIIEADVGITDEALRDRQRRTIGAMLAMPGAAMVTCMLGDTIQASASRAMGRLLLLGKRNIHHASTTQEAVALIAKHLGGTPSGDDIQQTLDCIMKGTEGLIPWSP